jgi:hypothetical protein
MAEGGGISYVIELDSADAEKALENLQSGAERLAESFKKIAEAISEGGLGTLTTVLEAAGAAVAGITGSLFLMAEASSKVVDELGRVAAQTGSTVEQMSTLKSALGEFGANTDTLGRAFQRMGNTIQEVWPAIQQSTRHAAAQIIEDHNNVVRTSHEVEQALFAQGQAYTSLARASEDASRQQMTNAFDIVGAEQNVRNAEIALAQAKGQTISAESLKENKIENAALALDAAMEKADAAEFKAKRDAEDAAIRSQQLQQQAETAELALAEAQQKAADAREKQRENEINSIDNLKSHVDALVKGMSGAVAGMSVDNFIKGLVASVGSGVTSLEGLGGSFAEMTKSAPEVRDVLLALADAFHNMTDGAQKMAIATKLFGRKDAADMVESLSKGSAAIKEMEDHMASLGLVISKTDEAISKKFVEGLNRLGNVIGIVGTQLGLLFQPSFTVLLDSMAEALGHNRAAVIAWGQAIADTVGPVIESFARVLAGTAEAGKDDWAVRLINGIKAIGTAATAVFQGVVMPLLRGLLQMAEGVALGINTVFGTSFTGLEVLIGAVLARLAIGFATLVLSLGPVGLAIVGIGLALGLLITYWPQIKQAASDAADAIAAKWEELKQLFADWVTTPVSNAFQWIADAINNVWAIVGAKIEQAKQFITDWVTTPVANAWQWIKDAFNSVVSSLFGGGGGGKLAADAGLGDIGSHAGGGLLGGRGTGTSDSNLAWVSRGEHIMPARAVSQPGVLAFLEALRRSGGNLRDVLDGMGRFAFGGLVHGPIAMPAFAGGGMNHVTIQFPGLPAITGLRASADVVEELRRSAALAQVRSGGRKPSRFS